MKAVFVDRDGTINEEVDNLWELSQLRIFADVPEGINKLHSLGYLVIVITNQPVVARGLLSEEQLLHIHTVLKKRLQQKRTFLDGIYYCPHHPNANLSEYRKDCECRKPNLGMINQAIKSFDIDLTHSFFIGDTTRDVQTAKNAKIRSILVKTGYAGKDGAYAVKPDFVADTFFDAVNIISELTSPQCFPKRRGS